MIAYRVALNKITVTVFDTNYDDVEVAALMTTKRAPNFTTYNALVVYTRSSLLSLVR